MLQCYPSRLQICLDSLIGYSMLQCNQEQIPFKPTWNKYKAAYKIDQDFVVRPQRSTDSIYIRPECPPKKIARHFPST